ncbi:hypothetical protein [Bradyrhizobium sp. SZCCHNR1098]|uniref:hypothetical protein n=1 Tax=Bradyrhizobium sp. SZCCHNR1098 TaxID=3057370 RepID=UPI00291654DB|nr:hypothetical protein [Bradyrhizobium sp. SZCCHNR1098]
MTAETIGHGLIAWGVIILATTFFVARFRAAMPEVALKYPWLPIGLGRKLFGIGIIVFAIEQAVFSKNYQPFVYWLLLPIMSPRLMVTASYYAGWLAGLVRQ